MFAYGAVGARFLSRGKPKHDISVLHRTAALVDKVVQELGYGAPEGAPVVSIIETDDPDCLRAALDSAPLGTPTPIPATFLPIGAKRNLLEFSFRELHREGIAIVWIEHIVHVLVQVVGRLVCMDAGRVIADGAPEAVMADAAVIDAYLGSGAR